MKLTKDFFDTRNSEPYGFDFEGFIGFCAGTLFYGFRPQITASRFATICNMISTSVTDSATLLVLGTACNDGDTEWKIMQAFQRLYETGNNWVILEDEGYNIFKVKFSVAWADEDGWINYKSGRNVNAMFVVLDYDNSDNGHIEWRGVDNTKGRNLE